MSVSDTDFNPLARIAQLHQEIASAELERRQLREAAMIALRLEGHSLRTIGKKVGLSHGAVNQAIAIYEAVNGPIRKAGDN